MGITQGNELTIRVRDYNLDTTLASGQVFRWHRANGAWEGVLDGHWLRLRQRDENQITVHSAVPIRSWGFVEHFLQTKVDLAPILTAFPAEPLIGRAVAAFPGLRLLRQLPWECLASFLLSSNKQIRQFSLTIEAMCRAYGVPVVTPPGGQATYTFPEPERIAAVPERELRSLKTGYRAPYLLATARAIADRTVDLVALHQASVEEARTILMELPGVGRKIADCVLLFAYGFASAFPVDVWIEKIIWQWYFAKRPPRSSEIQDLASQRFGPHPGYVQQYLYHYARLGAPLDPPPESTSPSPMPPSVTTV